jgi:hypothetical protein
MDKRNQSWQIFLVSSPKTLAKTQVARVNLPVRVERQPGAQNLILIVNGKSGEILRLVRLERTRVREKRLSNH